MVAIKQYNVDMKQPVRETVTGIEMREGLTKGQQKQFLIKFLARNNYPSGLYSLELDNYTQLKIWFDKH